VRGTGVGSAPPVRHGLATRRIGRVLRVESMATKYKDKKIASTQHREKEQRYET